jgi:thymidylate synthase (FAD)
MQYIEFQVNPLHGTDDAYKVIEFAARNCYQSRHKIGQNTAENFCRTLVKNEHFAMLEHAYQSFEFICDRGISHEIVRHRLSSLAQESSRYCNYSKDKFGNQISIIKPLYKFTEKQINRRELLYRMIEDLYMLEIQEGIPSEIARDLLPQSLKTSVVMTCNFREWRHILKLRTAKAAHPNIQYLMNIVLDWFMKKWPACFEDIIKRKDIVD